jgi:ABC-type dipeptide/oligopeptide/nickel transport system ATPase component
MMRLIRHGFLALVAVVMAAASAQAQSAPQKATIRLDWKAGAQHAPFYLAKARGFYKDEGLDVDIISGSGSSDTVKQVGSGTVDFGLVDALVLVQAAQQRGEELLASVGLIRFKDNYPHELSGGMKQRVAIVRALAWNPSILLMDEPFSALDELTKSQLQDDLLQIWNHERKTVLFVTHNISEAVYLADRVVVMSPHPGRIKTEIPVALPRPRSEPMRETPEFLAHARAAREALRS